MFNAYEEGKTLRTTMKGGTGNGLEIMLDIQQDEYLPVWGDSGRRHRGFWVFLVSLCNDVVIISGNGCES